MIYSSIIFAIILQLTLIFLAIRIIRVSNTQKAWIFFSIGFILITLQKISELIYYYRTGILSDIDNFSYWVDIIIAFFMITSLILIQKSLKKNKRIAHEKQESEIRFRALFNNSSDQLFLADLKGNFLDVNKEVCEALGYKRDELLKMNFADIKTAAFADKVEENINSIIQNKTLVFESEHQTKSGKVLYLEMSSRIIRYKGEKVLFSIARNITERKEFERKLLSSMIEAEERERRRFAKEMHDGLGPLLSTIKIYVNEIYTDEIEADEKQKLIKYTNELLDDAISNIRTISNNLMPSIIKDYGLIKAVDSLCKKVNLTNRNKVVFNTPDYKYRFESNIEIVLFRIIEELLNNTIKHAAADNVVINLETKNNKLIFNYADDGIGCPIDDNFINSKQGMGLKNIVSRVKSINASYSFDTAKPGFHFSMEKEL
ncbi:MAG: PAS domain S-box protein [Bacteroidetes bacterium]|nr:PAS domain S-box protein [Bacteroidota bacterium]